MGDIVGGLLGGSQADAASDAARLTTEATREGTQLQRDMWSQLQQNLQPYMGAGLTGLGAQMAMLGLGGNYGATAAMGGSYGAPSGATADQLRAQFLPQYTSASGDPAQIGRLQQQIQQLSAMTDDSGRPTQQALIDMYQRELSGLQGGVVDEAGLSAAIQQAIAQQQAQQNMGSGVSGYESNPALSGLGSLLTKQFSFDPSDLENTPGYQFTLEQGLKALNNQGSAQGLNMSGAQQKGLLQYATGLANQTYGDQYNRALQAYGTNYGLANDMYNRLGGLSSMGQNAAAGVGQAGQNTANSISSLLQSSAQAQGSALIGGANAQAQALPNLMNMAGTGAGIYSLLTMSDIRMKRDIERVGNTPGGHNLYRFRYLHDDKLHVGVMAQEVEQTIPDAVVDVAGVKYVDYSKVH